MRSPAWSPFGGESKLSNAAPCGRASLGHPGRPEKTFLNCCIPAPPGPNGQPPESSQLERVSLRSSQQVHLSPQETFAQFPSPFDCRMTPRVIHFERLIRKDCRWLSDWWDS